VAEQGLAFSPQGNLLAYGNDSAIEIWDVAKSKKVAEMVNPEGYYATQVSYSADGARLYAIINRNRIAQIWDISSKKLIRQVDLPNEDPNAFSAVALEGPLFARNNIDDQGNGKIEVWNLEKDETISILPDSTSNEPLVFSPDGDFLATFGDDDSLYIWNTSTGGLVYKTKFDFYPGGISISPDNKYLAVGNSGKASVFDFEPIVQLAKQPNLQIVAPQATPPTPYVLAWPTATPAPSTTPSSDSTTVGAQIIEGDNASQVQEKARFSKGTIEEVVWSSESDSILISGSIGVSKYTIDPSNEGFSDVSDKEYNGWAYHSVSLPNGQILSAGTNLGEAKVYVWDAKTGDTLVDLEGGGEPVLSPDGKLLVYLNPDVKLEVYDTRAQKAVTTLESYSHYSLRSIFSPDGQFVATVQSLGSRLRYEDSIRIWDVRTGEIVNALSGPDNDITNFSFSADGRYMVGAAGGSAWIWDLRPGAIPDELELYPVELKDNLNIYPRKVTAVGLSPNDNIFGVGTSEHTLNLYDRGTKKIIRELKGHSASIRDLIFSPNGQYLISVDQDGYLILWDVASGKLLADLHDYSGPIYGLLYQLDGDLSVWEEGTTWEIDPANAQIQHITNIESNGSILAASPAGDLLAVYEPFTVSLLDAQSGKFIQELEGEAEDPWVEYQQEGTVFRRFYAASFSPDGNRLVTAGTGGVWYYDTSTKRLLQQFPGNNAQKITLSPDSQWMLSSLYEQINPVSVYDLEDGNILFSLNEAFRGSDIPQAVFSPDKRWVGAVQW
jgi:WD40 repeat protein